MTKINSSPERHTFQKDGYVKRCEEKGEEPNPDYVAMYETWRKQDEENLVDPKWQKNNMEYDLRASKEMCDLFSFNDQNVTYSLSQLLGIQDWNADQVSRVNYFNTRTNKFDRNIGMPTLVVADGDLSFHRVFDHSDFTSCDIIGVIPRTMESDRLESLGIKMQPSLWYEPDCESINEIADLPSGISITVLKRRASK
jgi:hypothetical protein